LKLREHLLLPAGNFWTASAFIGSMIKPSGFERQKKLPQNQMRPFAWLARRDWNA
jgi:hypothetical protein